MMNKKKIIVGVVSLCLLGVVLFLSFVLINYFRIRRLKREKVGELKGLYELYKESGNTKIDFYGKVLDEDGNPLPGAKITCKIEKLDDGVVDFLNTLATVEQKYTPIEKTLYSDKDGMFSLEDEKGVFLEFEIEKDNYLYAGGGPTYLTYPKRYDDYYTADSSKPEVYTLWREDKTMEVIKVGVSFCKSLDEKSVLFNLIRGKITKDENDADIRITLESPIGVTPYDKYYDWSCSIEAINGGIIETDEGDFSIAPETGYVPVISYNISANSDDTWKDELEKEYYFKSRNGKVYGGIKVEYEPIFGKNPVTKYIKIIGIINPHGSRVLVYDYDKAIRDPDRFYAEEFLKKTNEKE